MPDYVIRVVAGFTSYFGQTRQKLAFQLRRQFGTARACEFSVQETSLCRVVIIKDRSYSINRDKTQLDELINAYEDMDATPQASYVGEDSNDEPQDISPIEGIPSPSPPSSPVPLPAFRKGARLFGVPIPTSPETQSQPHTSEDDTEGEGYQRSQSVGLMSS